MTAPFSLRGKVAVVTGGNGGIGLAIAAGLAEAGAAVAIGGRDPAKTAAALATLQDAGAEAAAFALDVADPASQAAFAARVTDRFGRCDVLVANAGGTVRKRPEELTLADWRGVLDVNLTGAFLACQTFHPLLRVRGGKIICIGSMYSLFGAPLVAAYAASKGGMVQLAKALAAAWADDGIRVNTILPGWIDTDLTAQGRREVPGLHDAVIARTPLKRWGIPQDVAGAAVFLAAPASDFITGAVLTVDGGYSCRG